MSAGQRFSEWLLLQAERQDPVGDLARDYRDDEATGCAYRYMTPVGLMIHMLDCHGIPEDVLAALDAAGAEWRESR